jgi:hypothetical protein
MRALEGQFTPIVVTAKDAAGNIGSAYIIIEKSNESLPAIIPDKLPKEEK